VKVLNDEEDALEFLRTPLPVYLFITASEWTSLQARLPGSYRLLANHWDVYKNSDVLVITNR
jgi:hypothetical protein